MPFSSYLALSNAAFASVYNMFIKYPIIYLLNDNVRENHIISLQFSLLLFHPFACLVICGCGWWNGGGCKGVELLLKLSDYINWQHNKWTHFKFSKQFVAHGLVDSFAGSLYVSK